MQTIISNWLYSGEDIARSELTEFDMAARQRMAMQAQRFADWLALENSRSIEASLTARNAVSAS